MHILFNKLFSYTKKIIEALHQSINGFKSAFIIETSFRLEVICITIMCIISIFIKIPMLRKICLIAPLIGVLVAELFNSAIEKTIDELGGGRIRERFRFAKDCGSAAVTLMLLFSAVIWYVILSE